MKYELKDFQAWIDSHKDWVVPSSDDTTPVRAYDAWFLKQVFEDGILPTLTQEDIVSKSLHELLLDFWDDDTVGDGGLQPLEMYMVQRNAFEIINAMERSNSDKCEILAVLKIVLRMNDCENIDELWELAFHIYDMRTYGTPKLSKKEN